MPAVTAVSCDTKVFARYFHAMTERGIYLPPSQFEAAFLSLSHGEVEIEETVFAAKEAMQSLSS